MKATRSKKVFRKCISTNLILLFLALNTSCTNQYKTTISKETNPKLSITRIDTSKKDQSESKGYRSSFFDMDKNLMQVLRRVFQDKNGNIWFVGDGVFYHNGKTLIDLSNHEIFDKTVVRQILEDLSGNIWFGTSDGIIKYTPSNISKNNTESFTKFSEKEGLINKDVWSMTIDDKGILWIGTLEGVNTFDGIEFSSFSIPESKPDGLRGVTSTRIIHSIMQDSKGRIWFGTSGGAFIFEGTTLSHISEKDGLCNDSVNDILEDKSGNIWFATHHNGVCHWDGNKFTHITSAKRVKGTESWSLYQDKSGNIWFPIEHEGVFRYNIKSGNLTNFSKNDGLLLNNVHSIIEDDEGLFWFGGFEGLYNYNGKSFVSITSHYPWYK